MMNLPHKKLRRLLQLAYSAEKAAALAYQGHRGSLKNSKEKEEVLQIEKDEWEHRECVGVMMQKYHIPVSLYFEMKFTFIGKCISMACYMIGRFMPFYFAGRLESGNVCEYFLMMDYFHQLNIKEHDAILTQMAIKEKEHELYFLRKIEHHPLLKAFEKVFAWGLKHQKNQLPLDQPLSSDGFNRFCQ